MFTTAKHSFVFVFFRRDTSDLTLTYPSNYGSDTETVGSRMDQSVFRSSVRTE